MARQYLMGCLLHRPCVNPGAYNNLQSTHHTLAPGFSFPSFAPATLIPFLSVSNLSNMAARTFTQFPELPLELRNMIWVHAISTQIQDITASLPAWLPGDWAERRRQAFTGHDSLPPRRHRRFLQVRIRDPYDGRKIRLEEDDFETLVNCLPLSAVCREARANTAESCWALATHIHFKYDAHEFWSLGAPDPEHESEPVLLRDLHCIPGAETLEHVFAQPTTLTINGGRGQFKSPEHLVEVVSRFFGNRVERLILEFWINHSDPPERPYWAHYDPDKAVVEMLVTDPVAAKIHTNCV
jgi:hypothetical protein